MTATTLPPGPDASMDETDFPSRRQAAFTLATLCLVSAILMMDMSLIGLLIEPIKHNLGLTDAQLGLLQGPASSIPYALCAIPMGMVIDRFPRVGLVRVAMLLWGGAMLAMALGGAFWILLLGKAVIGVACAILLIAPGSLMADLVPPKRRAGAVSLLVVGQFIGGAIGFLGGGLAFDLVTQHWHGDLAPWRVCFLLFAGLGLLLLPALFVMPEPTRKECVAPVAGLRASLGALGAYRTLLIPLFAAYALQIIADSSIRTWLPPALMRLYHLTPGQFGGWIGGTVLVGGLLGSTLGGWLAEWGRRNQTLSAAAVAAAILALTTTLALMPSTSLLFAVYLVSAIASGVLAIIVSAVVVTHIPNELRGFASGLMILVAVGPGLALGPVLVPAVSDLLGGPMALGKALAALGVPVGLASAGLYALVRLRSQPKRA